MRKLKGMAADALAAETTMTSPSQDANVWRDLMMSLAAGVCARYPDNTQKQNEAMSVYMVALQDGLLDRSKRALGLAQRLQESLVKMNQEGGEHGV